MTDVAELDREELINYIASVRGDSVAILMEIASDDELKLYLQSLIHTAELLGETIPGLVDPEPEEAAGDDEAPAAEPAPVAEQPRIARAAPSDTPPAASLDTAPPPAGGEGPVAPTNVDGLRQQVLGLLKDLAAETRLASPQQLGALRIALRIAKAKMNAEGS